MLPKQDPDILPNRHDFISRFDHGLSQLVWTTCPADLDTPVSAMLRLKDDKSPCFLLESVEKGEIRGRYSVIGLKPDIIWRCKGNKAEISYSKCCMLFEAPRDIVCPFFIFALVKM